MVICQFFLEGRCRFGQNCRNEHSYNNNANRNNRSIGVDSQQLKNIIREIVGEVIISEKGGQWPLSCFAPIKEGPNVPGWNDYSPEEIRWKMYEAKNKGNLNQCINEVRQLYMEAEAKRNEIKQPKMETINLIGNMVKIRRESSSSNPFGSSSMNANQSNSIFGGSVTQSTPMNQSGFGGASATPTPSFGNIFGNQPQNSGNSASIFGGSPPNFGNQNIFGGAGLSENQTQNIFSNSQPQQSPHLFSNTSFNASTTSSMFNNSQPETNVNFGNPGSGNIFSTQMSTPIFASQALQYPGTSTASNHHQQQQNVFGGSNQGQGSVFGSQTPVKSGENFIFETPKSSSSFSQNQSNFRGNIFGSSQQQTIDLSVYSKTEDLTPEELQAFTAPTFTFGKIPLKPPPLDSCK